MIKFSERLKEIRNERKLTQKEVAKQLNISTTCYAGYEQGYREPDYQTLRKICKFFNVTSDYLLGLED
ncbi:MAG: helix-turn-helix transcriptional regulator [Clostridia bacterium]|nr:helix-turn-helix transcriptional regulator [Clostridia bacterium]MBR2449302.1 helix-turn-helix transcriptional regulator [Clostridia bacterium]